MRKKTTLWLLLPAAALLLLAALALDGGVRLGWLEEKHGETWRADYAYFTGTETAALPGEGPIQLTVTTQAGSLNVTIQDQTGAPLFSQTVTETATYQIEAPSKATITLTAQDHKGGFART